MTVKDLIEKLKLLDQEKPIVIADADEGYDTWLNIVEVTDENDAVTLFGYYDDAFRN